MTPPELRTLRLLLVPYRAEDVDALHRLFTNPVVRRYLLDDLVMDRSWVVDEVEANRSTFGRTGLGQWSVRLLSTREDIVGFCGFREFFEPPQLQLLYGLDPGWHGQGLATEAARAVLRYAFEVARFDEVMAATDRPNRASIAVMERLGMSLHRESEEDGRSTLFYRLGRERFDPAGVSLWVESAGD